MILRAILCVVVMAALTACGIKSHQPAAQATVTSCALNDSGRPLAVVSVKNTSLKTNSYDVKVKFANGSTVLGTGEEYTPSLDPGQDASVRMAAVEGTAPAVSSCMVTSVTRR